MDTKMIKAYVIAIPNHEVSQAAADVCIQSSKNVGNEFEIEKFDAIVPDQVDDLMKEYNIKWNYPWEGTVIDFATGLKKSAYRTATRGRRVACSLSHYTLWRRAASGSHSYLVLEHDSKFIAKFNTDVIEKTKLLIFGINNPLYATRKSREFKELVSQSKQEVTQVPWIDDRSVPQGLAGNSAYIIKPEGAKKMLQLVDEYGLWPNDAIMCRQLFPMLGVTTKFYTQVQGTPSTTSD
jgi:GR25 family glycosyltransferase involved in LPS biosynthesis